ncbi:hypothetical protein ACIRD3_12175 [Kitasatospora sp. NPDC093550]|uniref:hypothetical protein n=1 Tax=Kitasatospora sp. NPDC093550 TaxID=3364089 RepID=UPI0037F5AD93
MSGVETTPATRHPAVRLPPARRPVRAGAVPRRAGRSRRAWAVAAEGGTALASGVGFLLWARGIDVDPLTRVGQVSGLAALQLRAAVVALPVLAVVLWAAHRAGPRRYPLVLRLGCAAAAGLVTGLVAGGIAVALHGTPWALGGQDGDPAVLQAYAMTFLHRHELPPVYPPGFVVLLAEWTRHVRHGHAGFALQDLQLLLSAVFGPLAYLAWRVLLRPVWALAVALPASVLFLDPIRPYSHLVMVVLLPVLGLLLARLATVHTRSPRAAARSGAGIGALLGALFLVYSGWFVWSTPGVLVAVLALAPWRRGRAALLRAAVFVGATALAAALVGFPLLKRMVTTGTSTVDRYAYSDVFGNPAYVLGWRSDRAGSLTGWGNWPSPGELSGQSAVTVLLLAGLALALALGLRRPPVTAALACLGSAWLLRFWFAAHMEHDQAVMLYPRTTWLILYSLLTLTVLAAMLLGARLRALRHRLPRPSRPLPPSTGHRLTAGALCALVLFGAMAASWSADRYLPTDPGEGTMGLDAWRAHTLQRADGTCSPYAPAGTCRAPQALDAWVDSPPDQLLWCGSVPFDTAHWRSFCGRDLPRRG